MASSTSVLEGGWPGELQRAESDIKQTKTAQTMLRVVKAARKLRRWHKIRTHAKKGLKLSSALTAAQKKEFKTLLREAETMINNDDSVVEDESYQQNRLLFFQQQDTISVDVMQVYMGNDQIFTNNLNYFHAACLSGDVRLMEDTVAVGCAIDLPVLPADRPCPEPGIGLWPAPQGCTALVLTTAMLVVFTSDTPIGRHFQSPGQDSDMGKRIQTMEECCVQLVMLGADRSSRLDLGDSSMNFNSQQPRHSAQFFLASWKQMDLDGKTAEELARMAACPQLHQALDDTKSVDDAIRLTHCRCGSRLPWKECHGEDSIAPVYLRAQAGEPGGLHWRVSPHAPCPCGLTAKTYFKCCWDEPEMVKYQLDHSARLRRIESLAGNAEGAILAAAAFAGRMDTLHRQHPMEQQESSARMWANVAARYVRSTGTLGLHRLRETYGPKCQVADWDLVVVVGCIERMNDSDTRRPFLWIDTHWKVPKPDLLWKAERWNCKLEEYCNEMGIQGAQREAVIAKHTASTLAPCANPTCDAMEQTPKGFNCCARCKAVAYCSRECQRAHWRQHKTTCAK